MFACGGRRRAGAARGTGTEPSTWGSENCGTPAPAAEPVPAAVPAVGAGWAGAVGAEVAAVFAPGVAAAHREQHSITCHQRPSRSVTTVRTTGPPHRQGSVRGRPVSGRRVWQPASRQAQYAVALGAGAARRWALTWASAAARPAAADGRRCSAQAGRLHEMRTAVLDVLHRDLVALRIHDGAFSAMDLTARHPRTGELLSTLKFMVQTLAAAGEPAAETPPPSTCGDGRSTGRTAPGSWTRRPVWPRRTPGRP